jgi:hypothetical protein
MGQEAAPGLQRGRLLLVDVRPRAWQEAKVTKLRLNCCPKSCIQEGMKTDSNSFLYNQRKENNSENMKWQRQLCRCNISYA